jgi:hypothetical protein
MTGHQQNSRAPLVAFGSETRLAENTSGLAKTGGRSTDSSIAIMSKIVEHLLLTSELKIGCDNPTSGSRVMAGKHSRVGQSLWKEHR